MARVSAFHSTLQAKKPLEHQIYHDNDRCFSGRGIPQHERREGDQGYRLCVECVRLDEALAATAVTASITHSS